MPNLFTSVILSVAKNPSNMTKNWILRYTQNDGVGGCKTCGFDASNK